MAFLTMIAPLVAMTYPIDKIKDSQAQAFSMWMKEYVYNALLQPFHLLLYYILVTTAIDLATENPIYAIVAIGFLFPAEKLLRKFFGFHNEETMSGVNAAIGGALISKGIDALKRGGNRKSKSGGSSKGNEDQDNFEEPVRTMETSFLTQALGAGSNNTEQNKDEKANQNNSKEGEQAEDNPEKYKGMLKSEVTGENGNQDTKQEQKPKTDAADNTIIRSSGDKKKSKKKDKKDRPHYLRGAGTLAGKFIAKSAKTGARLALRGTLAGTAAMIGVAGGLATGDYDKALSYGIAGAVAGGYAGGRVADGLQKLPSNAYRKVDKVVTDAKQTFRQSAYTPEQYKQKMIEESNNRFMNSKKYQEMYKQRYGKQYKQAMEEATAYRNQGVMDDKLIMRAMDLKAAGFDANNRADPKRIAAAKLASGVSNEKDIESVEKRLKELGIDENQIRLQKDAIRKLNNLV